MHASPDDPSSFPQPEDTILDLEDLADHLYEIALWDDYAGSDSPASDWVDMRDRYAYGSPTTKTDNGEKSVSRFRILAVSIDGKKYIGMVPGEDQNDLLKGARIVRGATDELDNKNEIHAKGLPERISKFQRQTVALAVALMLMVGLEYAKRQNPKPVSPERPVAKKLQDPKKDGIERNGDVMKQDEDRRIRNAPAN
jgi:hypothetical protein